ncbi:MAG: MXAN_6640 family putative metalloprotease [Nocardioidaceae bacterium]
MRSRLLALGLTTSLALIGLAPVAASAAPDETGPADGAAVTARAAARAGAVLTEAKQLFVDEASPADPTPEAAPEDRDATLVLRDLARRRDDLPTAAQRRTAARLLARPTNGTDIQGVDEPKYAAGAPVGDACDSHLCVHWVEQDTDGHDDSVSDDGDVQTVPAQVTRTLRTMQAVYAKEVGAMGYKAPLSDAAARTNGGDGRVDVYLADIGEQSLYGYCANDEARMTTRRVFAYCVLDNDYSPDEFGTDNTPIQNLQVTAAHEFFHAIQFAYDWNEDRWFMEGTAAWMEDEVYDSVNDNRQYFSQSQLRFPGTSLDFTDGDYQPYGAWVFWRFLSEWSGPGRSDDPTVIRRTWTLAQGARYSTAALAATLRERGSSFTAAYGVFGSWIRAPRTYFSEGTAYPAAPLSATRTLTAGSPGTGTLFRRTNHMAHTYVRFVPGASLRTGRLRVSANLPDLARGSVARVLIHRTDGRVVARAIRLARNGNGSRVVDFRRSAVRYVDLDLGNASTRFVCGSFSLLTCGGIPRDDGLRVGYAATAIR